MTKPLNRIAIALWILAALTGFAEACSIATTFNVLSLEPGAPHSVFEVVGVVWNMTRVAVLSVAQLVAFGVVIELVDQIRWNALQKRDKISS